MATASRMAPHQLTMESAIPPEVMGSARSLPVGNARPQRSESAGGVHPIDDRQHQPLQRQHGGGGEQRRQRAMWHFAHDVAAGARGIEAAEPPPLRTPRPIDVAAPANAFALG